MRHSKAKEQILDLMWEKNEPISVDRIHKELGSFALGSVHRLVREMEVQGLVRVHHTTTPEGKGAKTRHFEPTLSSSEYLVRNFSNSVNLLKPSIEDLAVSFVQEFKQNDKFIKNLEKLINENK